MIKRVLYETDDGKIFDNEQAALEHEETVKRVRAWDCDMEPIVFGNQYETPEDVVNGEAYYIWIADEKALNAFNRAVPSQFFGIGLNVWDGDWEDWTSANNYIARRVEDITHLQSQIDEMENIKKEIGK